MYNETYEIVKQHEEIKKILGEDVELTQTEETIRIHVGVIEIEDLHKLEYFGFKVLFVAADFPTGMFVAVKKEE
jgi:hypothetical protein